MKVFNLILLLVTIVATTLSIVADGWIWWPITAAMWCLNWYSLTLERN